MVLLAIPNPVELDMLGALHHMEHFDSVEPPEEMSLEQVEIWRNIDDLQSLSDIRPIGRLAPCVMPLLRSSDLTWKCTHKSEDNVSTLPCQVGRLQQRH